MKKIELVTQQQLGRRLTECLRQRRLPGYFLYLGDTGAANWLGLDSSKEFPVAARLTQLLEENLDSLAGHFRPEHDLVSIGTGAGIKERLLLRRLTEFGRCRYLCVDISEPMVDEALSAVEDIDVEPTGVVGFFEDMAKLRLLWQEPVVLAFLGNNFCNYEPEFALELVAGALGGDDLFLLDCHLLGDNVDDVPTEYQTGLNVRFNIQPLAAHRAQTDKCKFNIEMQTRQTEVGQVRRLHKWLDIEGEIAVEVLDERVVIPAGQRIEMGFTYLYARKQVLDLLERHGFEVVECPMSDRRENLLLMTRLKQAK